ncbi:MAG: hypothetical protein NVSMB44_44250 [Ktedonobacteraceae bacterium]
MGRNGFFRGLTLPIDERGSDDQGEQRRERKHAAKEERRRIVSEFDEVTAGW